MLPVALGKHSENNKSLPSYLVEVVAPDISLL
jgi:hypothetical protein